MENPYNYSIEELEKKALEIRIDLIKTLVNAGSGHSAGPLGMADIFTAFYFRLLGYDPDDYMQKQRDRLILSNGHIVPIRYVVMAHAGIFDKSELKTLRQLGSRLEGHPSYHRLPEVETSSGPLGEGLSQACGMAIARRLTDEEWDYTIYCLMSDGEQQEGMTWEAAMFAGKNRFPNFVGIIDRNNIQIDGNTEDIMPLEPLREKYEAFGWHVMDMYAHSFGEIIDTIQEAKSIQEKPVLIIANTTPGKGISFIENKYSWHGHPPTKKQGIAALRELEEGGVPTEKEGEKAIEELEELLKDFN